MRHELYAVELDFNGEKCVGMFEKLPVREDGSLPCPKCYQAFTIAVTAPAGFYEAHFEALEKAYAKARGEQA